MEEGVDTLWPESPIGARWSSSTPLPNQLPATVLRKAVVDGLEEVTGSSLWCGSSMATADSGSEQMNEELLLTFSQIAFKCTKYLNHCLIKVSTRQMKTK